jgi:hypothetical protein
MGYDFDNAKGDERWNAFSWPRVLMFAHNLGGWEPKGTALYRYQDSGRTDKVASKGWSGTYASNDGQVIGKEDGAALAAALRRALEIPGGFERHFGGFFENVASFDEQGQIVKMAPEEAARSFREHVVEFADYVDGEETVIE